MPEFVRLSLRVSVATCTRSGRSHSWCADWNHASQLAYLEDVATKTLAFAKRKPQNVRDALLTHVAELDEVVRYFRATNVDLTVVGSWHKQIKAAETRSDTARPRRSPSK